MASNEFSPSQPVATQFDLVPLGLLHVPVDLGLTRGSGAHMNQQMIYLLENAFWYSFGGCFLALFAYDAFHGLIDALSLLVTFIGNRIYNKSGGSND